MGFEIFESFAFKGATNDMGFIIICMRLGQKKEINAIISDLLRYR